jgi:HSP20 family molecular chaperone IbpA
LPQRECVTLRDMTDCLFQAYDCVARRAYEIFLERGGKSGGELDDWLNAERELLGSLPVDLAESDDYVSALASLPGLSGAEIEIGIDPRWMVILGRRAGENDGGEDHPDLHRVAEFSRAVSADARTLRMATPRAAPSPDEPKLDAANSAATPSGSVTPAVAPVGDVADAGKGRDGWTERSAMRFAHWGSPSKLFCVVELPAVVDPERSVAVLANGILGVRMPKASAPSGRRQ